MNRPIVTLAIAALVAGCSRTSPKGGEHAVVAAADASSSAPAGSVACPGDAAKGVTCARFAKTEDAFRWAVRGDVSVLAVGEAHAQKGTEDVASATKRFTDELLPIVADRAADIVVELWAPDPRCKKEVREVASAQKPVTATQAASNVNEYETLGVEAKKRGLTPWLLRPTCDDFSMLADAGDDAVPAMLGLVKRLTRDKVLQLVAKNASAGKTTIAYGGAMHNDVAPPEATAAYSFGPELVRATKGAYVELDLIVPEYVKKSPAWEKLPWYAAWEGDASGATEKGARATLYTMATTPPSYALIFPSR